MKRAARRSPRSSRTIPRRLRHSQHHRRRLHDSGRDAVVQDAEAHRPRVSAGARVTLGHDDDRSRRAAEEVTVRGETPIVQAATGEKSYTITTESVANLPLAGRSYDALLGLMPGVAVNPGGLTPASRLGGGGDSNFMLDGATSMDPGVNRPATRVSVEAIQEVRVATSTYQAEYGRAERPSGQRRHQERHEPLPRIDLRRRARLEVELQQQDQHSQRRSEAVPGRTRLRLHDRRPGRQARRREQAVLLLHAGVPAAHRRRRRHALPHAHRARTPGRFLPVHEQPRPAVSVHQGSVEDRRVQCDEPGRVLRRRRRRSARFPQSALYAPGMAILNWYPMPNMTNVPAGQAYNFETTYPATKLSATSRSSASTTSRSRTCAAASSSSSISSRPIRSRASSRDGMTRAKTTTASGFRPPASTGP